MIRLMTRVLLLILFVNIFQGFLLAQGRTIYINGSYGGDNEDGSRLRPYKTISKAMAAAVDGDTIVIQAGEYPEAVLFNKKVLVRSEGGAVTIFPGQTLFSGGFWGTEGKPQWSNRFGSFGGDQATIGHAVGADVTPLPGIAHAEAQRKGVLGADFTYSANVNVESSVDAHLQFRIADEGRYGIRLRTDGIVFYRFLRQDKPCSPDPSVFPHCPNWPNNGDDPQWVSLKGKPLALAPGSRHQVAVKAKGQNFDVFLDGAQIFRVVDSSLAVGRFGVYVWGAAASLSKIVFTDVSATTDPTQLSNLALLYSAAGYEAGGTKRALVRTLNDLPMQYFDPTRSRFRLIRGDGVVVKDEPLRALPAPGGTSAGIAKTFGMQLWEADFSSVTAEGSYTLQVGFATINGVNRLQSTPFEVRSGLVTARMLKPLSILNAEARRAADEDFRRNWIKESGAWSVALDGAFHADRADSQAGAVLKRVFNGNNAPLNEQDFRYVGRITIVSGCDAQMQFRITDTERLAVTLQAGAGGRCTFGSGPGAVRLHREGSGVQDGYQDIASKLFPQDRPFRAGQPYDVEILALGQFVTVSVFSADGNLIVRLVNVPVPKHQGGFALKAWASAVRFERVQAWHPGVRLKKSPSGVQIPYFSNGKSCQDPGVASTDTIRKNEGQFVCNPFFSQLHGFHDCNNIIGEATSHGTFLAGLMEVWTRRADALPAADQEALRRAIMTTALYLEELFQQGNETGEFAHSEMGRGGVDTNLGAHNSQLALYGESAFADKGTTVDQFLARRACENSIKGAEWLSQKGQFDDPTHRSIIYARIARCAARENLPNVDPGIYWEMASAAADKVLESFAEPEGMGRVFRDTGRVIPWFEGVSEVLPSYPEEKRRISVEKLNTIAKILLTHLTKEHACDAGRCAANGFFVLPQASGDPASPWTNWMQMDQVPLANRPAGLPFLHFYNVGHFATSASDAVYIGRLTGRTDLERIASGNLYWVLGLNPGVPASKVARSSGGGAPWRAASFVYNFGPAFARTIEGYRTQASSAKGWMAPWEVHAASPHRETWWIDPLNNGFQSIVNGHVLWDDQWDYWSVGEHGWSSGETFLLNDGAFLKAAMLFEDWLSSKTIPRSN